MGQLTRGVYSGRGEYKKNWNAGRGQCGRLGCQICSSKSAFKSAKVTGFSRVLPALRDDIVDLCLSNISAIFSSTVLRTKNLQN